MAALSRRLMRLRRTADPSFFVTVKPNLAISTGTRVGANQPSRVRASRTKAVVAHRKPLRTLKNSERRCNVTREKIGAIADAFQSSRQALAAFGATTRQNAQAADCFAALTETMAALTNELARLIGTFHDTKSPKVPADSTRCAVGHHDLHGTTVSRVDIAGVLSEVRAYRFAAERSQLITANTEL